MDVVVKKDNERMTAMSAMSAAEHWQAWLDRYGDDYATDEERRAAYRDFRANLAEMREVFGSNSEL